MKRPIWSVGLVGAGLLLAGGLSWWAWLEANSFTITDHRPPRPPAEDVLVDDRLEDKHTTFDPALVDRRPQGDWLLNLSEAVIRLDVPMVLPDYEAELLTLHPSYRAAIAAPRFRVTGYEVLPSVNMV